MKLPFLKPKAAEKEYFLALLLSTSEVRSILFEKTGESLLIVAASKQEFPELLDSLTNERLVELSDVVISDVEQKLPEGAVLEKTIFVLPHRWVQEGKIVRDHLSKLKSLCDALHLTPIGFIVSIEAIIAYLHKKQGVPVTAIFVEIGKKHITLSLVKNGNILSAAEEAVEKDPVLAVEKILAAQEVLDVLPAKIILLNFEHAKKTQQAFLSHSWSKQLSFLHIPQVDVLEQEIEGQAVISGVAAQMGFATVPEVNLEKLSTQSVPVPVAVGGIEKDAKEVEEVLATGREEAAEEKAEDAAPIQEESNVVFAGESIGFFKDVDVMEEKPVEATFAKKEMGDTVDEKPMSVQHEEPTHAVPTKKGLPALAMPGLPHISFKRPAFLTGSFGKGKGVVIYPILGLILFVILIVSYYFFFEKAQVVLTLDRKEVKSNMTVSFAEDKKTSLDDSVVHIDIKKAAASGKEEITTTGKKETGDKAKGVITLYNKTDSPKTFDKGTLLVGPNNLAFALTDDVKVASTSSFSTSFSSTDAKVEADSFGKEYNLPSASNFQVKGQSTSDYFGKNSSAFSGGTKKEIRVVSANDTSSLETKIVDELSKKAVEEASSKKGSTEEILPFPIDYSFDEKAFSKKTGDEAESLNLSAAVTYQLGAYKKNDLISLAKDSGKKDIDDSYEYSAKSSEIKVTDIKKDDDGVITGKLQFLSVFLPKVAIDNLAASVAGKSLGKAEEMTGVRGVSDDQVILTRSLPFFPKILPFNKNNIEIVVKD